MHLTRGSAQACTSLARALTRCETTVPQSAMGDEPIETPQQLSDRIQDAVARDKVKTLVLC
jgi:hypothetical protein